jgi:molybdopterin converting factor small subunit
MSIIRIPPVLRPTVGGAKQVEARGATLGAVLDDLFEHFPALRDQILSPDGGLNRFVNIFVADQDVRFLQGLDTPVAASETVVLLPAMAGGADDQREPCPSGWPAGG